jgi:hypothetical protein
MHECWAWGAPQECECPCHRCDTIAVSTKGKRNNFEILWTNDTSSRYLLLPVAVTPCCCCCCCCCCEGTPQLHTCHITERHPDNFAAISVAATELKLRGLWTIRMPTLADASWHCDRGFSRSGLDLAVYGAGQRVSRIGPLGHFR